MLYKTKMQKREPRQSQKKKYRYFHWLVNANTTSAYFSIHCNCSLINTAHFHIYNRCAHINDQEHNFVLSLRINNTMDIQKMKNAVNLKIKNKLLVNVFNKKSTLRLDSSPLKYLQLMRQVENSNIQPNSLLIYLAWYICSARFNPKMNSSFAFSPSGSTESAVKRKLQFHA